MDEPMAFLGMLAFVAVILTLAVTIAAVDEHRQRKQARRSEALAIQKIKEEERRNAA